MLTERIGIQGQLITTMEGHILIVKGQIGFTDRTIPRKMHAYNA